MIEHAISPSKRSMTLLPNWTLFRRKATRTRLLLCNCSGTTLLCGPRTCRILVCNSVPHCRSLLTLFIRQAWHQRWCWWGRRRGRVNEIIIRLFFLRHNCASFIRRTHPFTQIPPFSPFPLQPLKVNPIPKTPLHVFPPPRCKWRFFSLYIMGVLFICLETE